MLFAPAGMLAQPTLTAAGTNIMVGDQIVETTASYVSPGSAGANQTWNLSAMTTTSTATISIVAPGSTTNGSSFPNSNTSASKAGINTYYGAGTAAFEYHGTVASGIVIPYSNPEDLLHYPFTFNNTYSDNFAATFTAGGSPAYRSGTCTVTADGYGTVTTPSGTYPNCLRVHLVENYKDSSNIFGTPFINNYSNDQYLWFDNNRHWAVTSVSSLTTTVGGGSPTVSQTGTFFGAAVGIHSNQAFEGAVKLYPNPASSNVQVNIELNQNQKVELKVFNSLGEEVGATVSAAGVQGENAYRLDVSKYNEGVYFVQAWIDGTLTTTRRFVISR